MRTPPITAPRRLPTPPMNCRREGDQSQSEAGVVTSLPVDLHEQHAGSTGERAAERKRVRDDAVDVDAHQQRRIAILRGGPHRLADVRVCCTM